VPSIRNISGSMCGELDSPNRFLYPQTRAAYSFPVKGSQQYNPSRVSELRLEFSTALSTMTFLHHRHTRSEKVSLYQLKNLCNLFP
jgi:hypothetical protein